MGVVTANIELHGVFVIGGTSGRGRIISPTTKLVLKSNVFMKITVLTYFSSGGPRHVNASPARIHIEGVSNIAMQLRDRVSLSLSNIHFVISVSGVSTPVTFSHPVYAEPEPIVAPASSSWCLKGTESLVGGLMAKDERSEISYEGRTSSVLLFTGRRSPGESIIQRDWSAWREEEQERKRKSIDRLFIRSFARSLARAKSTTREFAIG